MDETVNDGIVFDASDISPVANELAEEQAEETNSSALLAFWRCACSSQDF